MRYAQHPTITPKKKKNVQKYIAQHTEIEVEPIETNEPIQMNYVECIFLTFAVRTFSYSYSFIHLCIDAV